MEYSLQMRPNLDLRVSRFFFFQYENDAIKKGKLRVQSGPCARGIKGK